jgi:hypothetical protein
MNPESGKKFVFTGYNAMSNCGFVPTFRVKRSVQCTGVKQPKKIPKRTGTLVQSCTA